MASVFSHAAVPIALNLSLGRKIMSERLFIICLYLSILPDIDVFAFALGIPYESQWGHRGFTHSIFFAAFIALLLSFFPSLTKAGRRATFILTFISTISHGILDALTNGGMGVAFFWPFNDQRYFFPWHQIEVSPFSFHDFLNQRGVSIVESELFFIWLPMISLGLFYYFIRNFRKKFK